MTKSKGIRDWILFFVFAGVPIVSFWLQNYPDTPFYSGMLVIFLIVLLWLKQDHTESQQLIDYDENLHFESFLWIFLGVIGCYFMSSMMVRQFTQSSIWVPKHNLEVTYGGFQLSGFWNDLLFQLVLVAPAEELCKLALHLAFYMKLKGAFGEGTAKVASIGVPIFFWSMLHIYRAYTGPQMATMLAAAFVGGLIIFAVMYKTRSLMAAILTHAGYNVLVLWVIQNASTVVA